MKTIILSVLLAIALSTSAYADLFQFVDRHKNSYIVSCGVYISGNLSGYTDGYGRIRIELPNGIYSATLRVPGKPDRVIDLSLNGSNSLKVIYVE